MAEVVAVDGGASRCRLAAYNWQGEQLVRVCLDNHASLTMGVDSAWQHIKLGIESIRQQLHKSESWQPARLVMGLAGSLQQKRRDEFLSQIPTDYKSLLFTDGHAQLVGASNGNPGICAAIGTGSVLHWLDEHGRTGMAGGWGFPVGDQGSGAWLGMRALQEYLHSIDGETVRSSLIKALQEHVGTDISSIQKWTTETRATVLAQLAPMVLDHAMGGDEQARLLINETVVECQQLISLAPSNLPVYVVGGIGARLHDQLADELGDRLQRPVHDALYGLWLLSQA